MKPEKARLDPDGTAEPKTRIVHHPNREHCLGPGTKLSKPEYEDESGKRIPLSEARIRKITHGYVEQVYDTATKKFVSQSFAAVDLVSWENEASTPVSPPAEDPYLPFDMVQPEETERNRIQLFDRVRSFDFADGEYGRDLTGPRANYIEGKVVGFADFEDCKRYAILVKLRIVGGNQVDARSDEFVYPPINGTLTTLGRRMDSVEVIG